MIRRVFTALTVSRVVVSGVENRGGRRERERERERERKRDVLQ